MRREPSAGGVVPAGKTAEYCRNLIDRLEQDAARFLEPHVAAGIIVIHRPAPRRLDARIVQRRPLALVRRRVGGPPSGHVVCGREIIARS